MSEEQAKELTEQEKQLAIEQYKLYGRIIPCKNCKEFTADDNGFGYCNTSRIVKECDWCSRRKEQTDD